MAKDKMKDYTGKELTEKEIRDMERDITGPMEMAEEDKKGKKDKTKKYAKGGSVGSASKRADGCAQRGKTRGRMV